MPLKHMVKAKKGGMSAKAKQPPKRKRKAQELIKRKRR